MIQRVGLGTTARRWRREAQRTSGWGGMLYVLPALLVLLIFEVWPIVFAGWISLWRWDVRPDRYVGLANYRRVFVEGFVTRDYKGDLVAGEVAQSLIVTVYYVLGTVPVTLAVSFVVAYLLFEGLRATGFLRTVYFLPYITASAAVALIFAWIFSAQVGVANALLEAIGLPAQQWLQDPTPAAQRFLGWIGIESAANWPDLASGPSVALVVIILYSIWSSLGYSIVVYLAGLTAIPRDLTDAARIDGAGRWTTMRTVAWPLLTPSTLFLLIVNTVRAFQAFDPVYTLTRTTGMGRGEAGGPLDTTLTITVYIFRNFYERAHSVGYAAAVSLLLFVLLLGLTIVQLRLYGRNVHYQ
jgi:ABC-type sugar transport system permease subunit